MWYSFRPYVSVAKRRAQAAKEVQKRTKKGQAVSPVVINGRNITETFWGKAWSANLESYSDYSNRLPRGRTYVRNGSVVDLQIHPGKIAALVSGSDLYRVAIKIVPLPDAEWRQIKSRCAGQIGSLVELLQGRLSKGVMDIVTAREVGLFPKPREIEMSCSCPDWASMCKHIAAVMYGVGARLDRQPELLFLLREVDHLQLIEEGIPSGNKTSTGKTLVASDVADVFGIELAAPELVIEAPSSLKHNYKPTSEVARDADGKKAKRGNAVLPTKRAVAGAAMKTAGAPARSRRAKKVESVAKQKAR